MLLAPMIYHIVNSSIELHIFYCDLLIIFIYNFFRMREKEQKVSNNRRN